MDANKTMTKEMSKKVLFKFEFAQIKRIYASKLDEGKVTVIVAEEAGVEKEAKVMVRVVGRSEIEGLKKWLKVIEEEMEKGKAKREEREKRKEEEFEKKREAKREWKR